MKEVTSARLLHDVWSGEARHLAKAVIAVYDCTVLHPGIGYHKFPVCRKRKGMLVCMAAVAHLTLRAWCQLTNKPNQQLYRNCIEK